MIVQIYEVTTPAEARALSAMEVDHIGVLVGDGAFPREVSPDAARAIFAVLPTERKRVVLSLSADPELIARVIAEARPDILHLGAAIELLTVDAVRELKEQFPRLPLMRSIPVIDADSVALAQAYEGIADFLLLDSHTPGDKQIGAVGRIHDWTISRTIVQTVPIPAILAGGLDPENVAAAIAAVQPHGVDSKTRTDRPDGSGKDLGKVAAFVAAAKEAVAG
ncbi:MAG: phosphoribosylanthranilate isomerase [Proteobacteria bacterium]|nr:phosphoribosylanthranilate isomerase [Pseudomonadota bacterium]